jgi:uncharacterized protein
MRPVRLFLCAMAFLLGIVAARAEVTWEPWSADIFAKAKQENRFVLLDLEAVWCHWCHVMRDETYADAKVVALLKARYVTVRVDQDANPDLASRYGNWGWPATIVFAPDGSEIVKRRGFIPPARMASLLQAIIDDPSPGPSVRDEEEVQPHSSAFLPEERRKAIDAAFRAMYDKANGGWGDVHRFIDADSADYSLARAEEGDRDAETMIRKTLTQAIKITDPEWGGMFQYSDALDWSSPHYEKIMWSQAQSLRLYAQGYARFGDEDYRKAADGIARYLTTHMISPEGAFFTSQDADVDASMPGKAFYAMRAKEREALGRAPRIDRNIYARENGWAISALVHHANATGDEEKLAIAETAALWIIENRALGNGGFAHGTKDRGGPFLGDTLAMGQAMLDLYAATGKREWLGKAVAAGQFMAITFQTGEGGFVTSASREGNGGVFLKPVKLIEEQTQLARFANLLHRYSGMKEFRAMAEHAMRYMAGLALAGEARPWAGFLQADAEFAIEPVHITIVGHKGDAKAQGLHRAARRYPALYKRVDWWDMREGALLNPDVQYPDLGEAAAFACSNNICSLPVFNEADLAKTVAAMLALRVAVRE